MVKAKVVLEEQRSPQSCSHRPIGIDESRPL